MNQLLNILIVMLSSANKYERVNVTMLSGRASQVFVGTPSVMALLASVLASDHKWMQIRFSHRLRGNPILLVQRQFQEAVASKVIVPSEWTVNNSHLTTVNFTCVGHCHETGEERNTVKSKRTAIASHIGYLMFRHS